MKYFYYMSFEYLKVFIALLFVFLFLFIFGNYLELYSFFTRNDASFYLIIKYYFYNSAYIINLFLPFVSLFASMFVFHSFAKNSEIAAAMAGGASLFTCVKPIFVIALFMSFLNLFFNEFISPEMNRKKIYVEKVEISKQVMNPLYIHGNWIKEQNYFLNFKVIDEKNKVLRDVEYFETQNHSLMKHGSSTEAYFSLEEGAWFLKDVVLTSIEGKWDLKQIYFQHLFKTQIQVDPPKILQPQVTSAMLSFQELRRLIKLAQLGGGDLSSREVELYQKISSPFTLFMMALLAVPFAQSSQRKLASSQKLLYIVLVVVLFWVAQSMIQKASFTFIPPLFMGWSVHLVFLFVGGFVFHRISKRRT